MCKAQANPHSIYLHRTDSGAASEMKRFTPNTSVFGDGLKYRPTPAAAIAPWGV